MAQPLSLSTPPPRRALANLPTNVVVVAAPFTSATATVKDSMGPTPGGSLPLSSIDKTAAVRVFVDFIQVFPFAFAEIVEDKAVSIFAMWEGFAKVLVHYYPVADTSRSRSSGSPRYTAHGEGVWFIEAEANCLLEEALNLEHLLCIPKDKLLPCPAPEVRRLEYAQAPLPQPRCCNGKRCLEVGMQVDSPATYIKTRLLGHFPYGSTKFRRKTKLEVR
uniref:Uncharacterized protein n=1 Tax=Oryza rufipogon TaxID=4529 RepID=A0A0E0QAJ7_ORYRU